jgi:hypothetical protein
MNTPTTPSLTDLPSGQSVEQYMATVGQAARVASAVMAAATTSGKNDALLALAGQIRANATELKARNEADTSAAEKNGLTAPMVDRLRLTDKVIESMAASCEQVAALPDPVGELTNMRRRPSGIRVGQMRVPIGVFGMIYESRPNVTIEAASCRSRAATPASCAAARRRSTPTRRWRAGAAGARASRPAGRRGAAGADHRPRGRRPADRHAAVRRRDHPARRQGPDRAHQPRSQGAGHQAPRRQLPHLRRRSERSRHGGDGDGQRQDAEIQPLQRHRDRCWCTRRRRRQAQFCPASAPSSRPRASRCAATRAPRPSWPPCRAPRCQGCHRAGLVRGIPRAHHQHEGGRRSTRRSRTSTNTVRTTPTPSSRATTRMRCASCARSIRPA